MLTAILSLTLLGAGFGLLLRLSARWLAVEGNPLQTELEALLPGSQCGQCGLAGCRQAAEALIEGTVPVTVCPPGGRALAQTLAETLGVPFDPAAVADPEPRIAMINEAACLGCMRCIQKCSIDAIVGANKQMHTVLNEVCNGCGSCVAECPTGGIALVAVPQSVETWHWHKPGRTPPPPPADFWHWRRLRFRPGHTLGNRPINHPPPPALLRAQPQTHAGDRP